ncbi:MAG TPA: hypothetical protein VH373_08515, partial [Jatrophihabitantaceae bacterium]
LHCNSVNLYGTDVGRLVDTAEAALRNDLHVWIQPRLVDFPQDRLLSDTAELAQEAERLRRRHGKVTFNLGSEFTIFAAGIIPGDTYWDRLTWLQSHLPIPQEVQDRLNGLLARARTAVRGSFQGDLTYASMTIEKVDWTEFDIVGVDHYRSAANKTTYVETLRRYQTEWNKPLAITEFGCCPYKGADDVSASGFAVIDFSKPRPEVRAPYPERSEETQATYLSELLEIFEAENVYAAFPFQFIQPLYPYSKDPRFDLDLGSFGVVRVVRRDPEDPASRYHWVPKEAFRSVRAHNLKYAT